MTEDNEKILFETIERAIEYGADRNRYGEFDFTELYKRIEELEEFEWMYKDLCDE